LIAKGDPPSYGWAQLANNSRDFPRFHKDRFLPVYGNLKETPLKNEEINATPAVER
jgi:hypothetical protein